MIKHIAWLALLLIGCSPYVPLSYNGPGSSTLAKIEAREATIFLEHIDTKYQHNIFDLEVINNDSASLYFSPQQISFYFSDERFPRREKNLQQNEMPTSSIRLKRKFFVRSPREVQELFQQKERQRATASVVFSLISVGLSIYDNVQDAKDKNKTNFTKKDVQRAATREAIVAAGFLAADIAEQAKVNAQTESYYLPFELFKEGEISSCEKRRGKIFLSSGEALRYLRIIIPICNKEYIFDFKKKE
jgi:hypothetical protein